MDRRDVLAGIAVAAITSPVMGQMTITERLRAQYEICKVRGHRPTQWGNEHTMTLGNLHLIPDGPPKPYPYLGEGDWQTCWDCKTTYRFVTTIEEKDTP